MPAPSLTMPARRVFKADWSQASVGLTGFLEQGTPPEDRGGAADAVWCTFPRPGLQGQGCVDPGPNAGYHTDGGGLVMTPGSPGYPIITKATFSRAHHLAIVCDVCMVDAGTQGAFGGPAIYNGEANYRAIYGQNNGDGVDLIVDATVTGYTSSTKLSPGMWYTLEAHYYPDGTWRYACDGVEFVPTGITDPGLLLNDPHAALFCGGFEAFKIGRFEVWSDAPNYP